MHDGAYTDLESAVRHMAGPLASLKTYDASGLRPELQSTVLAGQEHLDQILTTLDPYVATDRELLDGQVQDLLAFLEALSDPAAADLTALIPASVPSGLEVDR